MLIIRESKPVKRITLTTEFVQAICNDINATELRKYIHTDRTKMFEKHKAEWTAINSG